MLTLTRVDKKVKNVEIGKANVKGKRAIDEIVNKYREDVERELFSVFDKKVPVINDAVTYHLNSGGKRLRPIFCLAVAEALGVDKRKALPYAAACELLHNCYLIHDDIEDGDTIRRDKPAVWVKFGLPHAINVGDYMFSKVMELVLKGLEVGLDKDIVIELIKRLAETNLFTTEGQGLDINLRNNDNPAEMEYLEATMKKTGHYLMTPIIGAAIMARLDKKDVDLIIEYGKRVGTAFQIQDDLLDLTLGKGRGGKIGSDIEEGKRTLMVCHTLQKATPEEKAKLLKILNKPREKTNDADKMWVISLYKKYGSLDYARQKQKELIGEAKRIIASLTPEMKYTLKQFAEYVIMRKK